jgi:hypothetical protein
MEHPFTLLILLLLIGQCANGQDKQQPGSLQPPMPVAEWHRNPDYIAPDVKQPSSRRTTKRLKMTGEYAIPVGPKQAAPGATAPDGMPFGISTGGRWLIIGHQREKINNGDLLLREVSFQMELFGGPPMYQPLSTTRQ